jgi:hypothetical protein
VRALKRRRAAIFQSNLKASESKLNQRAEIMLCLDSLQRLSTRMQRTNLKSFYDFVEKMKNILKTI